jgi:hypothetical protein
MANRCEIIGAQSSSTCGARMSFPIKVCSICGEKFELKPDKPGFANRCPDCTDSEADEPKAKGPAAAEHGNKREANAARREAMRNLLYRKDS